MKSNKINPNIDSDGDSILDKDDFDDDNDGILDINEECKGFLAQNQDGTWLGKTIAGLSVSAPSMTSQTAVNNLNDGQINYWVNQNGGGPRISRQSTSSHSITYTFSTPVPAYEIAFLIFDVDPSVGLGSLNVEYTFLVNGSPSNDFISVSRGNTLPTLVYNPSTGKINLSSTANDHEILLKGITNTLVSTITLTSINTGGGDNIGYSLFAYAQCDTDGDGIPNHLDLDSDADGCSDAIEGAANITASQLVIAAGTVSGGSTTVNQNLCALNACVNTSGLPQFNTLPSGYSNTTGQGIGVAQNSSFNACIDSDGDGISNYQDIDNDNDGILDIIEGKCDRKAVYRLDQNATIAGATINPNGGSFNLIFTLESGGTPVTSIGNQFTIPFSYSGMSGSSDLWEGINSLGTAAFAIRPNTSSLYTGLPANNSTSETATEIYPDPIFNELLTTNKINQLGTYSVTIGSPPIPVSTDLATLSQDEFTLHSAWNLENSGTNYTSGYYSKLTIQNQLVDYGNFAETEYLTVKYGNTYTYSYTAFTDNPGLGAGNGGNRGFIQLRDVIIEYCLDRDTDGDGIPDYLDLDSDADGCSDAIEGAANITASQLVIAAGTVSGGSTTVNQNLCALNACVNTSGLPQFNILPLGYSNTIGQSVGSSANATVNTCFCYKPGIIDAGNSYPTKHGITALQRAGSDNDNWPMVRQSAWTVLESKEKGFVVNRVATTAGLANITNPVEGMMVYDEEADCLKIYTLKSGDAAMAWHCFTTPACPD